MNGDLLFVSNVGQARNAVRLMEALRTVEKSKVIVISTASAAQVSNEILAVLGRTSCDVQILELPERPTSPSPQRLRRLMSQLADLVEREPADCVWICNLDTLYSSIAELYETSGAEISYFEEGAGTYRTAEDFVLPRSGVLVACRRALGPIERLPSRRSLRTTIGRAGWLGRGLVSCGRLLSAAAVETLARRRAVQRLISRWAGPGAEAFFSRRTEFERAFVVFPELLDGSLIRARKVSLLVIRSLAGEIEDALRLLDELGTPERSTLVVSQPYVDRGPVFYGAVGRALRSIGLSTVFVTAHPREKAHTVALMRAALVGAGLSVHVIPRHGAVVAESLLATGRFSQCLAVSSTVLLYGEREFLDVEFVSVGAAVCADLVLNGGSASGLELLKSDVDLVDRLRWRLKV